jgi:hypothetical protein
MWCLPHVLNHLDMGIDSILGAWVLSLQKLGGYFTPIVITTIG